MTNYVRAIALFLLAVAYTSGPGAYGEDDDKVFMPWITNAVQWDSIWGVSEITCGKQKSTLSAQLAAQNHIFRMEAARTSDGVVAILPELHRLISVGLTSDRQLASLTIQVTCEPDLTSHYARLKALRPSSPVSDPRLQKHLEELRAAAAPSAIPELPGKMTQVDISFPVVGPSTQKKKWPNAKIETLKSIEAAAQTSFAGQCAKGERAVAEVPDFEVYDPAVLVVITEKRGSCILPVAFEHRQHSADPYVAYAQHHCSEDSEQVRKVKHLIRAHRASTITLECPKSP